MAYSSRKGRLDLARPVSNHPLNAGLVGWWLVLPHLYGGQRLWDLRNYAHGALVNGPTWQPGSRPGGYGALAFDGSDDEVTATFPFITPPLTLACWAYLSYLGTSDTYRAMISRGGTFVNDTNYDLCVRFQYPSVIPRLDLCVRFQYPSVIPRLACYWRNGSTLYGNEYAWQHGFYAARWIHAVAVIDAAYNLSLYCDATLLGTDTGNSAPTDGSQLLRIGAPSAVPTDVRFPGSIDDVRVYNRALSAGEVAALYRDSRLGHPETLRWLPDRTWSLPEQQGGAVAESPRLLSLLGVGC